MALKSAVDHDRVLLTIGISGWQEAAQYSDKPGHRACILPDVRVVLLSVALLSSPISCMAMILSQSTAEVLQQMTWCTWQGTFRDIHKASSNCKCDL